MTSDDFFEQNEEMFDIVFIDGLHIYDQVRRDIINSLLCLEDNGIILLHDCLPLTHSAHTPHRETRVWNGDVWRAIVQARTSEIIDTAVCLIDHGVGIICKRPNRNLLDINVDDFSKLSYEKLADNYNKWLNTIDYDEAMKFVKGD